MIALPNHPYSVSESLGLIKLTESSMTYSEKENSIQKKQNAKYIIIENKGSKAIFHIYFIIFKTCPKNI